MANKIDDQMSELTGGLPLDPETTWEDAGYGTDGAMPDVDPEELSALKKRNAAIAADIKRIGEAKTNIYGKGPGQLTPAQKAKLPSDLLDPERREQLVQAAEFRKDLPRDKWLEDFVTNVFPEEKLSINWFLNDGWKEFKKEVGGLGKTARVVVRDMVRATGISGTKLAIQGFYAAKARDFGLPHLGNAVTTMANAALRGIRVPWQAEGWDETVENTTIDDAKGNPLTDPTTKRVLLFDSEQVSDHVMNSSGITKVVTDIGELISGGVRMPQAERDWVDRSLYGAIMFWLPVIPGLPVQKIIKGATRFFKHLDDVWMDEHFFRFLRKEGYDGDLGKWMELQYRSKKAHKTRDPKTRESEFDIKDRTGRTAATFRYKHKYNVKRDQKAWEVWSHINRSAGAGLAYGISDSYLQKVYKPDDTYRDKQYIPILFALAGYMKGLRPGVRAGARLPGAMVPFVPGATLLTAIPPRWGFGITQWALFKMVGGLIHAADYGYGQAASLIRKDSVSTINRRLSWHKKWRESPLGRFSQYVSLGGDVDKGMVELGKGAFNKANWDKLVREATINPKAMLAFAKAVRDLPAQEREAMEYASEQFLTWMEAMIKEDGGVKGMNEMFLTLDQMIGTAQLRTIKLLNTESMKFGKGFLHKAGVFGSWWSRKSFLSELDRMELMAQRHTAAVAERLKKLQNQPESSRKDTHGRIVEFLQDHIITQQKQSRTFQLVRDKLAGKTEDFVNEFAERKLVALVGDSIDDGGFLRPRYTGSFDVTETNARISAVASENVNTAKVELWNKAGIEDFNTAAAMLRSINNKIYQQSDVDTAKPLIITNIINRMSDDVLRDNLAIAGMLGRPARTFQKEEFMLYAKKRFIEGASKYFNSLVAKDGQTFRMKFLQRLAKKIDQPGADIQFRMGKDRIGKDDILALADESDAVFREKLASIRGMNEASNDIINDFVPAAVMIKEAENIKTATYEYYNKSATTARARSDAHAAITELEKAHSDALVQASAKELKMLGHSSEQVSQIIANREKAAAHYRENIGEVLNTYYGVRLFKNPEKIQHADTTAERWTNFLFNENFYAAGPRAGKLISVTSFNKLFPKSVVDENGIKQTKEIVIKRWEDGKEVDHVIDLVERRRNAIRNVHHSIGERLSEGDLEWLVKLPSRQIVRLKEEGILYSTQADLLLAYKEAAREAKKNRMPPEINRAYEELNKSLASISAAEEARLAHNFPTWASKAEGSKAEDLIDAVFDRAGAMGLKTSAREILPEAQEAQKATETIIRKQAKYGKRRDKQPFVEEEIVKGRKHLRELQEGLTPKITYTPAEILADILKGDLKRLKDYEDLVLYEIIERSFRYTGRRTPFGYSEQGIPISRTARQEEQISQARIALKEKEGAYSKLGELIGIKPRHQVASLQPDLDVVAFKENMEKALPVLYEIQKAKWRHGGITHKSLVKFEKKIDTLRDIFQLGVFTRGKVLKLDLKEYPVGLSRKQQGGRLYNWARGFVHPGYLGVEATMMNLQLGQARFMRDVIMDPKNVETFAEVVINNGQISWGNMKHLIIGTIKAFRGPAAALEFEKREFTEEEKNQYINDFYIHLTGKFSPDYLDKLAYEYRTSGKAKPAFGYSFPGLGSFVTELEVDRRAEVANREANMYGTFMEGEDWMYPGSEDYLMEQYGPLRDKEYPQYSEEKLQALREGAAYPQYTKDELAKLRIAADARLGIDYTQRKLLRRKVPRKPPHPAGGRKRLINIDLLNNFKFGQGP